jgi:hypothetical protein
MKSTLIKRLALVSLILLGLLSKTSAQSTYSRVSIASPNAASLGKFVDNPVNYHTGIPQINIPIYTIKEGSLELPISLSYHAGGVKVAETASWVGTGWALNAGGVITRTVRGIPDEAVNTSVGRNGHFKDFGFSTYMVGTEEYVNGVPNTINSTNLVNQLDDGEPDLFFFNFNGHSGKFYFNDDRTPVLVSANEDLKIDYYFQLPATASSFLQTNIQGFCITVADGTKYYFGKTQPDPPSQGVYPVEISFPFTLSNGASSDRVVSSWFLSKVESADKSSAINLIYDSEQFSSYSWSFFKVKFSLGTAEDSKGYELIKMYTNGIRLSKIVFSNGTVSFIPETAPRQDLSNGYNSNTGYTETANTEARALKQIVIQNNNRVLKRFSFNTSYFLDNQTSAPTGTYAGTLISDSKRLKLDSVVEIGGSGGLLNPYVFGYYSNFLPRRLSYAIDHWGFYNGAANTDFMPAYSVNTYDIYPGANRDSAWPYMENGALIKITYPTGGSDDFTFEPNQARVNTTKYSLQGEPRSYSVGYDGGYTQEWTGQAFTGNQQYQIILSNSTCRTGTNCIASYMIKDVNGSIVSSSYADAGTVKKVNVYIPPGMYTISLFRENSTSGNGASLGFNRYVATQVANPIVGGLRIKKISKNGYGTGSQPLIENYTYEENNISTGELYDRPNYLYQLRSDLAAKIGINSDNRGNFYFVSLTGTGCIPNLVNTQGLAFENTVKSPGSILPLSTSQGSNVGYRSVKVDQGTNGFSVYRYLGSNLYENNLDDVAYRNLTPCDIKTPSFPFAPLNFEFSRGELSTESHFNNNGVLLKEIFYTSAFDSTKVFTPAIKGESFFGFASQVEYQLRGYWKKYTATYETVVDPITGKQLTKSDTLFYDSKFHRSLTRQTSRSSEGLLQTTRIKYALDYKIASAEAIPDGWNSYINGCESCKITYESRTSTSATTMALYYHLYRACLARARKEYIAYRRTNFSDPGNSYNVIHNTAKNNADDEFKPILEMQDQFINPSVEVTKWKNNSLTEATYSKFGIEPGTIKTYLKEIYKINNLTSLSSPYTFTSNTSSAITKDSRLSLKFLYRNVGGNIIEQHPFSGAKDVFIWGYQSKYPVAKISIGDYNVMFPVLNQAIVVNSNTSDAEMRTELNKLRTNFPNAFVNTYTYDPLVGITSQTDAKGYTTFYEYDEFQRLLNIKDYSGNIIKNFKYNQQGQ